MTTIYTDTDFNEVWEQKRKVKRGFWIVLAAYVIFCLGWEIYYTTLPYKDSMQILPKVMIFTASVIFVVFLFVYMGIKYHRVKRYYKMMYYLSEGIKITEQNYFAYFAKQDLQKDSVDVLSCIFKTWNPKKNEWLEREVYFDTEKEFPDLEEGDFVRYITQSNFLVQYEVVKRAAICDEDADKIKLFGLKDEAALKERKLKTEKE